MLKQRLLTALFVIPLVIFVVLFSSATLFWCVLSCFSLIGLYEFLALSKTAGWAPFDGLALGAGLGITLSFLSGSEHMVNLMLAVAVFLLAVRVLFAEEESDQRAATIVSAAVSLFGVLTICWFLGHLVWLRERLPQGEQLLLYVLLMIWANDSAAYFTGSAYGKTKMAATISPNKSWEGFSGGVAAAVLVGVLGGHLLGLPGSLGWIAGMLVSVVGPLGDLSQSYLKRIAGVKDSGSLFPGHGGVLDRLDSLIMCAPFLFYLFSCYR